MLVQRGDGALNVRYRCSPAYDGLLNSPEHFHVCERGGVSLLGGLQGRSPSPHLQVRKGTQ